MFEIILKHYSSLSSSIVAIAAVIRYANVPKIYRSFLVFIFVGAGADLLSIASAYIFRNNMIISNSYALIEFLLLLRLFYLWNNRQAKNKYVVLAVLGVLIWILDSCILHALWGAINSIYRIYYCAVLMFLSIDFINKLIIFERKKLIKNPMFLICIAFVCYFSYKAYIESFYLFGFTTFSKSFYYAIFLILRIINLLSNLMYLIAIICLPKRQEFSMPR